MLAGGLVVLASAAAPLLACVDLSNLASGSTSTGDGGLAATDGHAEDVADEAAAGDAALCSADLTVDPNNCGRCGRSCGGAACANAACNPIILASALGVPNGIVVDADHAYVTTFRGGQLLSIPKAGGPATVLVTMPQLHGVDVAGQDLVWASSEASADADAGAHAGIWTCKLPACSTPSLLVSGAFASSPLIRDGWVYYFDFEPASGGVGDSHLRRILLSGGPSVDVAVHAVGALAVDDTYAYFGNAAGGALDRTKRDGSDPSTEYVLGPRDGYAGLVALDDTRVYFAYSDAAFMGRAGSVAKAAIAAGTIEYGATADDVGAVGIAVDNRFVYWSATGSVAKLGDAYDGNGRVFACPKAGCPSSGPIVLALNNAGAGPMAQDDTAIYWVEYGNGNVDLGRVRKVAKP
jgi:hypothetical protein